MWSSRLFWKLFLAYAGLILATAVVLACLVSTRERGEVLAYQTERLHDDAVLLRSRVADDLVAGRGDRLGDLTRDLAAQTGTRITLIRGDGTVLADSEQDPAQMENHASRTEIRMAAERGEGVWTHFSRTLGFPMHYLALRVDRDGAPAGFVRVALPMSSVDRRVAAIQRLVWGISLLVGVVTLAVTYAVVARITRPLARLTSAAQRIAAGEYGHRVSVHRQDELGTLGDSFDRMSAELGQRVTQMHEDRELLATVFASMIEGVVAVDRAERILFANSAARALLEFPSGDIAGRPLWELVRHRAVEQAVRQAFAGDQLCLSEFEVAGSSRRIVALHAARLPGDPPPGVVLVLHDVTGLRRLENLRQEFVANVSHELKTPLSSIKAYAETLLEGALGDPKHNEAFVRQIAEQAERLNALIIDLLSLAQIESGQQAFEIVPVPVAELIARCVAQHGTAAAAKRIRLEAAACDAALRVLADAEGLGQILSNLVGNAIKYTPDAGCVTIRCAAEDLVAVIHVSDTGIGIAPADQARVFERFYRVDRARSRELGGTGLGLAIVKHLVQAFGGTVALDSALGRGSTFSVRLPRA